MQVKFYYNQSDYRVVNKILQEGETFEGVLREECSIMAPSILFEKKEVLRYNYCYIPEFQRYYSVVQSKNYCDGLWLIYLEVDVLMSFRGDIYKLKAVVDKQAASEIGDEYIDDSSLVSENILFNQVYNFPNGFNNTGTYILITAG